MVNFYCCIIIVYLLLQSDNVSTIFAGADTYINEFKIKYDYLDSIAEGFIISNFLDILFSTSEE